MNKSLKQQLLAQFYRRNLPIFLLSVFAALPIQLISHTLFALTYTVSPTLTLPSISGDFFSPTPLALRHHSTPYCCLNKSATMFCF